MTNITILLIIIFIILMLKSLLIMVFFMTKITCKTSNKRVNLITEFRNKYYDLKHNTFIQLMKTFQKSLNLFKFHLLVNHQISYVTIVIMGFLLSHKIPMHIVYAAESEDIVSDMETKKQELSDYGRWSKSEQIFLPAKTYKDIDFELTQEKWENEGINNTLPNHEPWHIESFSGNPSTKEDSIYNNENSIYDKVQAYWSKIKEHMKTVVLNQYNPVKAQQVEPVQPIESLLPAQQSEPVQPIEPLLPAQTSSAVICELITEQRDDEIRGLFVEFTKILYNNGLSANVSGAIQVIIDQLPDFALETLSNGAVPKGMVRIEFMTYFKEQYHFDNPNDQHYVAAFRAILHIYDDMVAIHPETLSNEEEIIRYNKYLKMELQENNNNNNNKSE